MSKTTLRYRQVHLDFHTSAACEDVGADFDPRIFAETVKMGHVDSMTIFAKCHHGFSYYPTKVATEHPHLKFDLMGQQIEALHSAGIRAPIYITLMWDDLAGEQHPEWIIVDKAGREVMRPPLTNQSPLIGGSGWTTLDLTSGYGDYVIAQVEEISRNYQVDGFFFDICFLRPNYSTWNQARLRQANVRLDDEQGVMEFTARGFYGYLERLSKVVKEHKPDATVFFNGTVLPKMAHTIPFQTHLEIESLPTSSGIWGYLHYPVMSRQARTNSVDFLGMTGRFHKAWADFGGLKTHDQLDYECGTIVAAGGKISVGDQLHPRGVLDPAVYRLLGHSFSRIERLEPWLDNARPSAEVALLATVESDKSNPEEHIRSHSPEIEGAAQLLLESAIQFDIIEPSVQSLSSYKAIIVPDAATINDELRTRLEEYLGGGGKLILSGTAVLNGKTGKFGISGIPVSYVAPAPTVPSYLRLDEALVGDSELATDYDYVFYNQAHIVKALEGATTHGALRRALFNRTWEHFTSHAHAPVGDYLDAPLVVSNTNVLYFAAPLFSAYHEHDYWAYRAIALKALHAFLGDPLLIATGPGWAEFTLHTQPASEQHPERKIVHVVTYHPRRTTQPIQHVDQSWTTAGLSVKVRTQGKLPQRVYLSPDQQPLAFTQEDEYTKVELPPISAHAVVVLE
ncbi:MAG: hypothetical protein NVSMB44_36740 [Ktedonobacteraceae bacterium]